jgi:lipoate-protein ligase A
MRVYDQTFRCPEENLTFDERLLERGCEAVRVWESAAHFVVLGRSGRIEEEVNLQACEATGIPVLRRSSGGGTVLQGPGCLTYAFVLSLEDRPVLHNVADSYRVILNRIIRALRVPELQVCGSDICVRDKKVSGNAQRRSKGWLLHHGTLLHTPDVSLMRKVLLEPKRQPTYRERRTHEEFVSALPMPAEELKRRITAVWNSY